ncbi:MAG: hypothetical protein ACJ72Z_14570 [Pyrinomonadaceae bacterium]
MFCPKCGSSQPDDLRFCKQCGANLAIVRTAVTKPESVGKFDWNKTWLAEMMMSGEEAVKRAAEMERLQGITPETKRRNEIKGGVITASAGVGIMIVLFVLMNGIILSGRVSDGAAEILSRIWIAGVIPLFVGAALIFNGMFISKRADEKQLPSPGGDTAQLSPPDSVEFLPPADTNELFPAGFSVTDETTRHLDQHTRRKS